MKFAIVAKHRNVWSVSWICAALRVSRSGFHAWLNRPASAFNPPATPPWQSDVRAIMRTELQDLDRSIQQAQGRAGDAMTRIHLRDLRMEIERILSTER